MAINFNIDTDQLTIADFLLIEDAQAGKQPVHAMTGVMARFMVDDQGAPLTNEEAMKILGGVKWNDFTAVAKQFAEALQTQAVPLATKGNS